MVLTSTYRLRQESHLLHGGSVYQGELAEAKDRENYQNTFGIVAKEDDEDESTGMAEYKMMMEDVEEESEAYPGGAFPGT